MTNANAKLHPREIGALVALLDQEKLSAAEHQAHTLLTAHPDAGILWKILSVVLMRQGKDALQALRRTTELMPQDAEAHANLGAALHDAGQWAAALVSLQRALAIQPHETETLVNAANALRALGRVRDSVALYHRALEGNPRHVEAQNNLGNALLELGLYDDAAGRYRLALELSPSDAKIHGNLGNALWRLGLLQEATISSRRAIALDPSLSVAHNQLGLILMALGQREEAVAHYRQALALQPGDADALINLGNVLRDLGARREAASLYARAIEAAPGRPEGHANLGSVLFEVGRLQQAVQGFRQALALKPDHVPAHLGLASAFRQLQRIDDAEASCRAVLDIDPNAVEALTLLGELSADRGRFSEAEQLFHRAISINPDYSIAFFGIAKHRKMSSDDADWLAGTTALLGKQLPLGHEVSLHYALGKFFDDTARYDQAFAHYERANELTKRNGAKYDRAKRAEHVETVIRSIDGEFIRGARRQSSASEIPVFVVGMPRSGTSLTEQILASHPAVYGAGELPSWDAAFSACQAAQLADRDAANPLPQIADDYLARLTAPAGGALRVVDKMPANFLHAGLIHAALPRARIIHMQRHPIDTCLSIYFQNFLDMGPYANDLEYLAHYYGEYLRVMNHWRALLPAATLLEVPYEALIEDPEGWTRRMLDFIGLPWDPKCLDFHQTERVVITASHWQVRQKISKGSVGRWRNYERFVRPLRHLTDLVPSA